MSASWPPPGWDAWGGVIEAPIVWLGPKRIGANLDYTVDISNSIDPTYDFIVGVTGQAAPSGDGELTLSMISVVGYLITVFLTGGQPSRTYAIPLTVTMSNNRVFEFLLKIRTTPNLDGDQPQPVPSSGYGPVVVAILSPPPSPGYAAGAGVASAIGAPFGTGVGLAAGTGAAQATS